MNSPYRLLDDFKKICLSKSNFILLFLICFIIFQLFKNLSNNLPWYDEAMQFWISYSNNPDDKVSRNGLSEVVKLNQMFNHDPGGFSILLFLWMKLDTSIYWIRLLPLLIFIISLICLFKIGKSIFKDSHIAILFSLCPFLSDTLIYFSTEIRAYSMECLCSAFSMLTICILSKNASYKNVLIFSILLSLFMMSRYSAMIFAVVSVIVTSIAWVRQKRVNTFPIIVLLKVPILMTCILCYFLSLKFQNPSIQTPNYIDSSTSFDLLSVFIILFPFFCLIYFRKQNHSTEFYLSLYVCIINIIFLFLTLKEIHPADIRSKYCIGMHYINVCLIIIFCIHFFTQIKVFNTKFLFFLFIILGITFQHNSLKMREDQNYFDLDKINTFKNQKIFIDKSLFPSLKYFSLFGESKNYNFFKYNQISNEKQSYHYLGKHGQFVHSRKSPKDTAVYDVILSSTWTPPKKTNEWKKLSNFIYLKND
jgi:hypothetical protein